MSDCREVSDRLSTLEILKASECSSQHLKTQSYQGFPSFMGVEMSVEENEGVSSLSEALLMRGRKRTWFTCINRSRRFLKRKMDRGKKRA